MFVHMTYTHTHSSTEVAGFGSVESQHRAGAPNGFWDFLVAEQGQINYRPANSLDDFNLSLSKALVVF